MKPPRQTASAAGAGTTAPPTQVTGEPLAGLAGVAAARRVAALGRRHWPVVVVFACYIVAACIVPTLAPVPISDDWVYARTVEILFARGELEILDLSVVTQLFQTAWGALFAALFGVTFGSLRLSTVVLVLLSGGAVYGLCRQLGVDRARAALGTAAYLFNPLGFVLGFTFMSDPHFTAMLVITTFCYVRGLYPRPERREEDAARRWILAGAVAAALAFLVRQQGALIPFAVVLALLFSRRLRPDRRGVVLFAQIVAVPAVTTVLYYLWLRFVHGVPRYQTLFLGEVRDAGWDGARRVVGQVAFIGAMYAGFFGLPLAVAALPRVWGLARRTRAGGWLLFGVWEAIVVAGVAYFGAWDSYMPYVPQFLGPEGLGPQDLFGGRPALVTLDLLKVATGACAASILLLTLACCGRIGAAPSRGGGAAGLVGAIVLWQVLGILAPSFHFLYWAGSLDRYLLPLLPFTICLGLWALRDVRLLTPAAWVVVAAFALFAVAGTRDFLVFQDATWDMARYANALGVPNTRLDAGASWDGYHLYEYSRDNRIPQQTPDRPWWVDLFAPATNSHYLVSTTPFEGYETVAWSEYSSWLQPEPTYLYLLRRSDVPGPP